MELYKIQSQFASVCELSNKERQAHFKDRLAEKKKLNISFSTFEELNSLQNAKKHKISQRTNLGLKDAVEDDWISNFNIGNIMLL